MSKKPNKICGLLLILSLMMLSCKQESSLKEYSDFVGNPEHKILQSRTINGIKTSVQYIPNELDAYKEAKKSGTMTGAAYDSLLAERRGTLMFWLIIEPAEEKSGEVNDVMMKDVQNYQQYNERFQAMNFDLKDKIRLKTSKGEYEPIYALLENTFGVGSGRKAIVFFGAEGEELEIAQAGYWEFIYTDDNFGIGTLHYLFEKADIEKIPMCNFRQILSNEKK